MSIELKITEQENKIINYLNGKQEVTWEELAQFAKNPQSVKLNTIKKTISEIKRKYTLANLPAPFNVNFISLTSLAPDVNHPVEIVSKNEHGLTRVTKSVTGHIVKMGDFKHQVQIDFKLDPLGFKKVITKYGSHQLNDSEWDMFKYFYNNPGKLISISELKDNVVFPNYGSKLPARWFDAIMRIINHLRRQVVSLDKRLLTVKSNETSYIFH